MQVSGKLGGEFSQASPAISLLQNFLYRRL